MRYLIEWCVPRAVLQWDWERPFCRDSHIWLDPRVALLHPISDLFPWVPIARSTIEFNYPTGNWK